MFSFQNMKVAGLFMGNGTVVFISTWTLVFAFNGLHDWLVVVVLSWYFWAMFVSRYD